MASFNEHTGDALVSRPSSKEFNENFDKIFGKKKTNGGWKPPLKPLEPVVDTSWGNGEARMDNIGPNGNDGEHYKDDK